MTRFILAHVLFVSCLFVSTASAQSVLGEFDPSGPNRITRTIGEEIVSNSDLPLYINDLLLDGTYTFASHLSRNHSYVVVYFDGPAYCAAGDCLRLVVEFVGEQYVNPVLVSVDRDLGMGRDFVPATEPVYADCRLQLPEFCIDLIE